jgi:RHS repeat-associated protein
LSCTELFFRNTEHLCNFTITRSDGTYTYDNNGSTLTKVENGSTTAYTWNTGPAARMVGVTVTDANGVITQQMSYQYDADGMRVSATVNGEETRYLLDTVQAYPQVLEEYTPDGTVKVSYIYGNDLISQTRAGSTVYYHVDGLGSTRVLTDTQGQVIASYDYEAFGELINSTGSAANNYLFAGEQYDANLGDYYLRQRFYNPSTGRFGRRDTWEGSVNDPLSLHKYLYAHGNPVINIDPSGLVSLSSADNAAVLALIGALAAHTYIQLGSYQPERLGGFGEDARPTSVLDGILAWRSTWAPETLSGYGEGTAPTVPGHTGHARSYDDFVTYVFTYDTTVLRGNLAADGRPVPPGYAAHHIVAGSLGWWQEARDVLASKGIDVNDAENGAVLINGTSTTSSHQAPGRHARATAQKIIDRIRNLSPQDARAEMRQIGQEMENGTFDLN